MEGENVYQFDIFTQQPKLFAFSAGLAPEKHLSSFGYRLWLIHGNAIGTKGKVWVSFRTFSWRACGHFYSELDFESIACAALFYRFLGLLWDHRIFLGSWAEFGTPSSGNVMGGDNCFCTDQDIDFACIHGSCFHLPAQLTQAVMLILNLLSAVTFITLYMHSIWLWSTFIWNFNSMSKPVFTSPSFPLQ